MRQQTIVFGYVRRLTAIQSDAWELSTITIERIMMVELLNTKPSFYLQRLAPVMIIISLSIADFFLPNKN